MNLAIAQLCLDCEEIFEYRKPGDACPKCGSRYSTPIKNYIEPIESGFDVAREKHLKEAKVA